MRSKFGAVAQSGERVLCKHDVAGSIPVSSIYKFRYIFIIYKFFDILYC